MQFEKYFLILYIVAGKKSHKHYHNTNKSWSSYFKNVPFIWQVFSNAEQSLIVSDAMHFLKLLLSMFAAQLKRRGILILIGCCSYFN